MPGGAGADTGIRIVGGLIDEGRRAVASWPCRCFYVPIHFENVVRQTGRQWAVRRYASLYQRISGHEAAAHFPRLPAAALLLCLAGCARNSDRLAAPDDPQLADGPGGPGHEEGRNVVLVAVLHQSLSGLYGPVDSSDLRLKECEGLQAASSRPAAQADRTYLFKAASYISAAGKLPLLTGGGHD